MRGAIESMKRNGSEDPGWVPRSAPSVSRPRAGRRVWRYAGPLVALVWCGVLPGGEVGPELRAAGDILLNREFETIPRWSGGTVVAMEKNPSEQPKIRVFDEHGREIALFEVKIPGAKRVLLRRAAHGAGNSIAICGTATDSDEHIAGFFAIGRDGEFRTIVRTEPYVPSSVTISPDGSVWTTGIEVDREKSRPRDTDKGMIRHFDAAGKELADFVPQSGMSPSDIRLGISHLVSSSTRIGWYQGMGQAGYFEVAGGRFEHYPPIEARPDKEASIFGLAVTEDGSVFATRDVRGANPQLYWLDRQARTWIKLSVPEGGSAAATAWLLGGSGDKLVFQTTEGSHRLRQFEVRAR